MSSQASSPRPGPARRALRTIVRRTVAASVVVGIASTALLAVTSGASASTDTDSTLGLLAYDTNQPLALGDTSRYAYVVLQENQYRFIPAIKAANPATKVLSYMEAGFVQNRSCPTPTPTPHKWNDSFGLDYCWIAKHRPEWVLKDRSGNPLSAADYPLYLAMDMGLGSYAQRWAEGTYANASVDGFDGVWLDDVNLYPGHGLDGRIAKYTDVAYGSAVTAFTSRVGDYLRSYGMTAFANVAIMPWVGTQMTNVMTLGTHITAVNREHFSRYGDICGPFGERFNYTATNGTPPIDYMIDFGRTLQSAGIKMSGIDYGLGTPSADDRATMSYGRVQFLLGWDGSAGSAYFYRSCGVHDTASPEWTTELGQPTGPVVKSADGILTRNFERGMVMMNPNRSASASVAVPSGMKDVHNASVAATITLAPETAVILTS